MNETTSRARRAPAPRIVLGASLIAASVLLAACSTGGAGSSPSATAQAGSLASTKCSASGPKTPINVSETLIVGDMIPYVYANNTNLWAKYGLQVNDIQVSTATQFTALGAGQSDIALGASTGIEAASKGAPIKVIGSQGNTYIELLAAPDVKKITDLKGKKVGASAPGSQLGTVQDLYLQENGLKAGDYQVIYTSGSFAAAITALVQGQTQGNLAGHPFIDTALAGNPKLHSLGRVDKSDVGIATANIVSVNTDWAAKNGPAVVCFIRAYREAVKESNANPTQSAGYLATAAKVDPAIAQKWVTDQGPLNVFAPISQSDYTTLIKALSITLPDVADAKYKDMVDNQYADAAGTTK